MRGRVRGEWAREWQRTAGANAPVHVAAHGEDSGRLARAGGPVEQHVRDLRTRIMSEWARARELASHHCAQLRGSTHVARQGRVLQRLDDVLLRSNVVDVARAAGEEGVRFGAPAAITGARTAVHHALLLDPRHEAAGAGRLAHTRARSSSRPAEHLAVGQTHDVNNDNAVLQCLLTRPRNL